jgi:hypothetical protein
MSYQKHLKEQSKEYDIPYPIFREMLAKMKTICDICWINTDATRYEMLRKLLWDNSNGIEILKKVDKDNTGMIFQDLYFIHTCKDEYKEEHIHNFLQYWEDV